MANPVDYDTTTFMHPLKEVGCIFAPESIGFLERIQHFVESKLIGIVPIVSEDSNSRFFIILKYRSRTCCTSALPIITLADDVKIIINRTLNKACQRVCIRHIGIISKAISRKRINIYIMRTDIEKTLWFVAIIYRSVIFSPIRRRSIKTDNGGFSRKQAIYQRKNGFSRKMFTFICEPPIPNMKSNRTLFVLTRMLH